MKNKKGFTLIELLAVIVILAIIALIAVPIILNMINSARKSAARSSALGYIDSIEYYAGFNQISNDTGITGYDTALPEMTEGKVTCTKTSSGWNSECSSFFTAVDKKSKGKKPDTATIIISSTGKVLNGTTMRFGKYDIDYDGKDAANDEIKILDLYNYGEEYSSITGGWILTDAQTHSRSEKLSDSIHMYISSVGSSGTTFETSNSLDLSKYSKLHIKYKINNVYNTNETQYNCLWYVFTSGYGMFSSHNTPGEYTDVIDISELNNDKISFFKYDADINIYKIWIVK